MECKSKFKAVYSKSFVQGIPDSNYFCNHHQSSIYTKINFLTLDNYN